MPKARVCVETTIPSFYHEARSRVARTVNTAMLHAYWLVGREIVEVEQLKAAAHP